MTGTLEALFAAQIAFVGGHFFLSWGPVRSRLVRVMGPGAFRAVYSLAMAAALVWVVFAYRSAPFVGIYDLGAAGRVVPLVLMPFALILAVLAVTAPNPTAVGGERFVSAPRGVTTITRHPLMAGVALWSLGHLAANGDARSILLFGGMAVLALVGMAHIDARRAAEMGGAWRSFARDTARIPFGAIRHTRVDWRGIGWVRPMVGLVLYLGIAHGHTWLFGVPAIAR